MKNSIWLLFLCCSVFAFSQEKKSVKSGYITFNSNSILEFKNLEIAKDSVSYENDVTKSQMKFALGGIKKIVDGSGVTVYESENKAAIKKLTAKDEEKTVILNKSKEELLEYKSASKIYKNGQLLTGEQVEGLLKPSPNLYDDYKRGKSGASLGSILIGGGIGLFIGGGLSNLSQTNGGGPALLIVGIVTSVVGIPVRLGGVKKIKEAVKDYNNLPKKQVAFFEKSELKMLISTNGLGFQWHF
ncbi:hypothetical protein [Flavobacterium phycosphaerae]|uniref:hypothetical protein n=1 Tax=Flavobacterium phycosphaerae TaxID=2697515 RepID=UPI001389A3B3|nr:hypothetical protein [Flavobacterium phycosphaerae]